MSAISGRGSQKSEERKMPKFHVDDTVEHQSSYKIYRNYSCKLKHYNIERNKEVEKYYIIQLLERLDKPGTYCVFSRWGREGKPGSRRISKSFENVNDAKNLFEKRFQDKCGVEWNDRENIDEYTDGHYVIESEEFNKKPTSPKKLTDSDDIEDCLSILKDICYEINIFSENKEADKRVRLMSEDFFNILPKHINKRNFQIINDNKAIKDYSLMLNDLKYKQQKEE